MLAARCNCLVVGNGSNLRLVALSNHIRASTSLLAKQMCSMPGLCLGLLKATGRRACAMSGSMNSVSLCSASTTAPSMATAPLPSPHPPPAGLRHAQLLITPTEPVRLRLTRSQQDSQGTASLTVSRKARPGPTMLHTL